MGRSSKPRDKTHQPVAQRIPKYFSVPMVADELPDHAHKIYAAIYAYLHQPTLDAHNYLLRVICEISRGLVLAAGSVPLSKLRDPHSRAVLTAIDALGAIEIRYYVDAVHLVTENDAKALLEVAGRVDVALRSIPFRLWGNAQADVAYTLQQSSRRNKVKFAEAAARCEAIAA